MCVPVTALNYSRRTALTLHNAQHHHHSCDDHTSHNRFVTKELISRGFNVTAFAREKAGIKGKMSKDDTAKVSGCGQSVGEL